MSFQLVPLPEIPDQLKDEIQKKNVVFFLGAGISRMLGCSGWSTIARKIVEKCYDLGHINFRLKNVILNYNDPKKMLTLSKEILTKKGDEDYFFWEISKSLLGNNSLLSKYNIYGLLSPYK